MRCDRAVILLATGGAIGRWRARRHAVRCVRCAAEAARLGRIARELAAVEPLSAARRAVWTSMSTKSRPEARPIRYRPALLAGAAAAAVLFGAVGLGVAILMRPPRPKPGIEPSIARSGDAPRPVSPAVIRELDDLRSGFQALSRELAQLRRRAELLDERRDAESLAHRFDRSLAFNVP